MRPTHSALPYNQVATSPKISFYIIIKEETRCPFYIFSPSSFYFSAWWPSPHLFPTVQNVLLNMLGHIYHPLSSSYHPLTCQSRDPQAHSDDWGSDVWNLQDRWWSYSFPRTSGHWGSGVGYLYIFEVKSIYSNRDWDEWAGHVKLVRSMVSSGVFSRSLYLEAYPARISRYSLCRVVVAPHCRDPRIVGSLPWTFSPSSFTLSEV